MPLLIPSLITVTTMSLLVGILYLILYMKNRDRLLMLWGVAWGIYTLRFVVQIAIVMKVLPPSMVIAQEAVTLAGALLCLSGANALGERPVALWWRYGAVVCFGWIVVSQTVPLPFFLADIPSSFYTGLLFAWSGITILRLEQIRSAGRIVAGYSLILWGIHRADYPFLRTVEWIAPWGFLLASVLFLSSAIGILLLYYDRIQAELEKEICDRSLAQVSLVESENRLRDIMFSMADWVWEIDSNGVYTYSSEKGYEIFGRSPEDVIGKTLFDFIPPDESRKVVAIFSEILANKAPIKDLENWYIKKNGERVCLLTNGVPILDEQGNLKGYRGVDKDITERKQAEEEKRRFYRDTIKSVTQGKLDLVSFIDVKEYLNPTGLMSSVISSEDSSIARRIIVDFCTRHALQDDRLSLFVAAAGEAMTNSLKHAEGCQVYGGVREEIIWIAISDNGPGISQLTLPSATLRRGFSSKVSMGMGYTIMMEATDNIMLCTGSEGSTVVLSLNRNSSKPIMSLDDFPDTWDEIA